MELRSLDSGAFDWSEQPGSPSHDTDTDENGSSFIKMRNVLSEESLVRVLNHDERISLQKRVTTNG